MVPNKDQVIVSSKKPNEGNQKKIWIQERGKNLFNYESVKYISGYINTNADAENITSSVENNHVFAYVNCKPNTTYTISKKAGSSFRVATFSNVPQIGSKYNSTQANHTGTSITIQTGENDNYIGFVCFSTSNGDTGTYKEMYKTVQVEEGGTATTYEAYIVPAIHTKKNDNEYEELLRNEEIRINKMELGIEDIKDRQTEFESDKENIESTITEIYNQQEALKSRIPIGENIQWLDCKVLYESETGFNTGNITLTDIIGNHDYVEIYYKRSNLINTSGKIPIYTGNFGTTLHTISSQGQYVVAVYFDNNKISIGFDYKVPFNGSGIEPSTEVAIVKVIGYKKLNEEEANG